jgi:hypothetical protein
MEDVCQGCLTIKCYIKEKHYEFECPCRNCLVKTTCEETCNDYHSLRNYLEPHIGI